MKINKFNESAELTDSYFDEKFPIKCEMKHRIPNPGICWVTKINFENKTINWSNGYVSSHADFKDIEFIPDIFIFNKYGL